MPVRLAKSTNDPPVEQKIYSRSKVKSINEFRDSSGAAARMLDILSIFDHDFPSGTAKEIAVRTGLSESTLFRLLGRLMSRNFLQQDPVTRRYSPGLRLCLLGDIALLQLNPPETIRKVLDETLINTGENSNYSIWRGGMERTCLFVSHSNLALREFITVGETHPLWLGASGKVIGAYLPYKVQKDLALRMSSDQKRRKAFLDELQLIKQAGISITEGDRIEGVIAISAPIFHASNIFGSITVSGPTVRVKPKLSLIEPYVRAASRKLSS